MPFPPPFFDAARVALREGSIFPDLGDSDLFRSQRLNHGGYNLAGAEHLQEEWFALLIHMYYDVAYLFRMRQLALPPKDDSENVSFVFIGDSIRQIDPASPGEGDYQ